MKSSGRHVSCDPAPIDPAPDAPLTEPTPVAKPVADVPLPRGEIVGFMRAPPDIDDNVD